jgi:hypothetical protein
MAGVLDVRKKETIDFDDFDSRSRNDYPLSHSSKTLFSSFETNKLDSVDISH